MNPVAITTIKFKKVLTKKRLINLSWILLVVGIIVGGYFLGKNVPKIDLIAVISRVPSKIGQSPAMVEEKQEEKIEEEIEIVLPMTYEEEAQKGEGITHLARKALKRYLTEKGQGLNLTPEHKIYIEDYMQNKTGDYWLKVGQKVTFSEELIKEAIDQALKLTPEQLQNLTQYAKLVPELNY